MKKLFGDAGIRFQRSGEDDADIRIPKGTIVCSYGGMPMVTKEMGVIPKGAQVSQTVPIHFRGQARFVELGTIINAALLVFACLVFGFPWNVPMVALIIWMPKIMGRISRWIWRWRDGRELVVDDVVWQELPVATTDPTFFGKVRFGTARLDQIDDAVEAWHLGGTDPRELHDALGMTFDEYGRWVRHPEALDAIYRAYLGRVAAARPQRVPDADADAEGN